MQTTEWEQNKSAGCCKKNHGKYILGAIITIIVLLVALVWHHHQSSIDKNNTNVSIDKNNTNVQSELTQEQFYQIENGDLIRIGFTPSEDFMELTEGTPFKIINRNEPMQYPYLTGNFIDGMEYQASVASVKERLDADAEMVNRPTEEKAEGIYVKSIIEENKTNGCEYIAYELEEIKNIESTTASVMAVNYTTILGLIDDSNTGFVITTVSNFDNAKAFFDMLQFSCENVIELDNSMLDNHTGHTDETIDTDTATEAKPETDSEPSENPIE